MLNDWLILNLLILHFQQMQALKMIFFCWYFALSYVSLFESKVTAPVSVAGRHLSIFDKR